MLEKVEVRVLTPNINLTAGEKGEQTESPEVGSIIAVREDQVDGGLNGKVRRLSDEPKPGKPMRMSVRGATEFLIDKGYVVAKADSDADPVADATTLLLGEGFTVTKEDQSAVQTPT